MEVGELDYLHIRVWAERNQNGKASAAAQAAMHLRKQKKRIRNDTRINTTKGAMQDAIYIEAEKEWETHVPSAALHAMIVAGTAGLATIVPN